MLYVKGLAIGKLPHLKLPDPLSRKTASNKFPPGLEFGFGLEFGSRAVFWGEGQSSREKFSEYRKVYVFLFSKWFIGFQLKIFLFHNILWKTWKRVSIIYQTKLIERNRNFEPNLRSFLITQSLVASCMSTDFTKWNSFFDIFSRKNL